MNGIISPTALHTKGENTRSFIVYSVWNSETDELIIIDGEARKCAKAMGLAFSSFYSAVSKARNGKVKKWIIKERYLDGRKKYSKWERKGGEH